MLENMLAEKSAVELRKIGAQWGIAGAAKGKKADLIVKIATAMEQDRLDRERKEAEAKKAPAKKAKTEKAPKVRKIRFTQDELAMEENGHSDQGHDSILSGKYTGTEEVREAMKGCPICHPEIVANTAHSGSSRAGMKINVPLRADGRTKAETVATALGALKIDAKIRRYKGHEILTAKIGEADLKLEWDAQGRYVYILSSFNGRKVRNVSEALRLAAK